MTLQRKNILLITGALILTSSIGIGVYIKARHDSAKKASPASQPRTSDSNKSIAKKAPETPKPKPVTTIPPQIPAAPKSTTPAPQPAISLPAQILSLTNWKLQLPIDTSHPGSPDEIKQPELSAFVNADHFNINPQRNGVVFKAHAGGATTANSKYPRSELREMSGDGRTNASWSNSNGSHTMTIRQAITHLPDVKNELVAGQIHGGSDDVIMIRLEGSRLFVESGGENIGDLEQNYALGTIFTVKIVAEQSSIKVFYNDAHKVTSNKSGDSYYFKAGCYTQTNTTKGDSPASYGEVVIYDLRVSHT